ncbi:MAG: mechanosensitive ion channel [Gemmatimonadetes bacterium]|nr:mechanosensitive ion channel [Gemmatimonadota bacterium]
MIFALLQAAADSAQAQPPTTVVSAFQTLLDTNFGISSETLFKVLMSLATLVAMSVIRRLLTRLLEGRFKDPRARYQFTKSLALASSIVTLIAIGTIWLGALKHMGAFLGLVAAGVAFALKDLIADIAGWAFIMWKRPFEVGDRIEIAGFAGDVVDIRIFEFTLLEIGNWVDADQSTGRVVHIPNQKLLSDPIANYTAEFPYVWNEIPVLVTFESDWKKAKAILAQVVEKETGELSRRAEDIIPRATRRLLISYRTLSATVYTNVRDSGVLLTVRHLAEPRARRGVQEAIWEGILDAFAEEPDIELAYPTRRMYSAEYRDAPLMAPRPQLLERERPSGDTVGEDTRSG